METSRLSWRVVAQLLILALAVSACNSRSKQHGKGLEGEAAAGGERVVGYVDAKDVITVKDVRATPTKVTGSLINKGAKRLRDVQLMIQHAWLWKNERHPGKNNPSRTEFYQVLKDIPPNGTVAFEYHPAPPLPQRKDGHFETHVAVTSYSEVSN